jgi:hypothetical protein
MPSLFRLVSLTVVLAAAGPAAAQVVYLPPQAGDFSLFANGDLAGQNGWLPVTTTPTGVQISGGRAVIQSASGTTDLPDARYPFAAAVPATAGTSYYVGLTFRVTSVNTTSASGGDVVATHTTSAGDDGIRLSLLTGSPVPAGQYALAICGGPIGQFGANYYYNTSVSHQINQTLRIILAYDFVAGTVNDRMTLYVDPASPVRAADTAEVNLPNSGQPTNPRWTDLSDLIGQTIMTPGSIVGGTPTPGFEIGRITAADNFAAVYSFITPVPEPSGLALVGGLATCFCARRRRIKR